MWLTTLLAQADLVGVFNELTPVCLFFDANVRKRHVRIERPTRIDFVPDDAVYIEAEGQVAWDLVGVEVPLRLRKLRVRAAPAVEVVAGEGALVFELQIEYADLSAVPGFIESRMINAVNETLNTNRASLTWHFTRMLDFRFQMPASTEPRRDVRLRARKGAVRITSDGLLLSAALALEADAPVGAKESNLVGPESSAPAMDTVDLGRQGA